MSSWARVGVKCVWVDVGRQPGFRHNPRPASGTIVTIDDILLVDGITTLVINGWPNENLPFGLADQGWDIRRFRPLQTISQADDVAMFKGLVLGMTPTERLDRLAELLDTTPS